MPQMKDEDGRKLERLDERTENLERRQAATETKLWAVLLASIGALINTLAQYLPLGR